MKIPEIRERPSPNHGPRPPGVRPDILLLHYTGMRSAEAAISRLCDAEARVSAHYVIDEAGRISRLVQEDRRAWHAGRAVWAGRTDINSRSIGVELVNPGHAHGYRPFPDAQMTGLEWLCRDVMARHAIVPARVLGHSDVAPQRKEDPGELFDWSRLARAGIGIWPVPRPFPVGYETPSLSVVQADLRRLGYGLEVTGAMDAETRAVILAFQRHWLPWRLTGAPDPETGWRLQCLLAETGAA